MTPQSAKTKSQQFGRNIVLMVTAKGVVRDANAACLELLGDAILGTSLVETERMQALGGDVLELLRQCSESCAAKPGIVVLTDKEDRQWPWACEGVGLASGEVMLRHRIIGIAESHRNEVLGDKVEELVGEVEGLAGEVQRSSKAAAEARSLAEAKSRFLAAASHDLRQPLHAMTLFTRALGRRVATDEKLELVEQMDVALASLRRMFDALLDISKLDGGLIHPVISDMPLSDVLEVIGVDLTIRAQERGLKARVRPLDVQIRTDRALFETILHNLVNNAVKFTRRGGILIGARRRGDHVQIEVVDTGMGIADDRLRAVFDEFERGRSAADGQNDGLGLGLSIVARLTTLLNIGLELKSRHDHGTRVILTVPLARRSQDDQQPDYTPRPKTKTMSEPFAGRTIIVLDDEPLVVTGMARELMDLGANVISAHSTTELESQISGAGTIDAAVVDYDLGDELGPHAIDMWSAAHGLSFPVLIVTGSTNTDTLQYLQNTGRRWVNKPVDPDLLVAVLHGMLQA